MKIICSVSASRGVDYQYLSPFGSYNYYSSLQLGITEAQETLPFQTSKVLQRRMSFESDASLNLFNGTLSKQMT